MQTDGETVTDFISLASKITADSDRSHEIKILLLFGRKAMTNLDSVLKSRDITLPTHFGSTVAQMVKNLPAVTFCHPLLLLPSVFLSTRGFSSESALCIRWPKYWSFNFSISPSNEYWGLISFRIDWFDILEVQGTLKSLLQHHSLKASVLWHSAFFWSNSHIYMTTGKKHSFDNMEFLSAKWYLSFLIYCLSLS